MADGLTKYLSIQDLMIVTLSSGRYTVADDDSLMARAAALKNEAREKAKLKRQQEKAHIQS